MLGSPAISRSVAIVDGYSTGQLLAPAARLRGLSTLHVRSTVEDPAGFEGHFNPDHYDESFQHRHCILETARWLSLRRPKAVMAGAESGVTLTDQIASCLELKGNPIKTTLARRNKGVMWDTAQKAGLAIGKFAYVTLLEQALHWARSLNKWPIVVKPPTGAGTVGVKICHNEQDVIGAFDHIFKKINDMLLINDEVVLQEYLEGPEFAVNTVSSGGEHRVTGVWQYTRAIIEGAATIADTDRLMRWDEAQINDLVSYAFKVLDAVQIKNGPGHMELKVTPEGVRLVEVAARLAGARMSFIESLVTNQNPIEMNLDAYLDPRALTTLPMGYLLKQQAMSVFLRCEGEDSRFSERKITALRALPGVFEAKLYFKEGDLLPRSVNADTLMGQVILLGDDLGMLQESSATIQEWQRRGEFVG